MPDDHDKSKPDSTPSRLARDPWFVWLLMTVFIFYFAVSQLQGQQLQVIDYSDFIERVEQDLVDSVSLRGTLLKGRLKQGYGNRPDFQTQLPEFVDQRMLQLLQDHGVAIEVRSQQSPIGVQLLVGFLPWVLIIALFVYFSRNLQSRMGGGLLSFSQSKARRFRPSKTWVTYDDVAGLEGAKQDLGEIVAYLKDPERFHRLGAKMPKGILMMGAPGTGKTLLAKATAAEAGVAFFSISGSEFIELFVGVGASRVRDMFKQARKEAPALIFIDEIDSVGRVRGTGLGGGNDEREQTLNQILAEMDGFEADEVVVVLAATNRPDVLDPALLRPGRFDRKVILELPQKSARLAILQIHSRETPLAMEVDLELVAAMTVGFSGADLENLVNEAALRAARLEHQKLTAEDFQQARDKVLMGGERKDLINASERRRLACHESGHALVAFYSPQGDPLQKVSIVPRGQALGMTEQLSVEERHNIEDSYLHARLCILLGGRCAEKLVFGNVSSGAADDLKQATKLARSMVVNWGMSEALGPVVFSDGEEHPFLGRELSEPRRYSEATAQLIDQEIKGVLQAAEAASRQLILAHRAGLNVLTDALLQQESLERAQLQELLQAAES